MKTVFAKAISEAAEVEISKIQPWIVKPKKADQGDLSFACFEIAKETKANPGSVASQICDEIALPEGIVEIKAVGPYINARLDRAKFIPPVLEQILNEGDKFGSSPAKNETVLVEYSSPNIAKTFHVGHLRTTLIGHALVQIYRKLGYKVVGINHLGDWGTQFGFVWAGCELFGKPANPSVAQLLELYQKANAIRKDQDGGDQTAIDKYPPVNQMAREYFIKLEAGEEEAFEFWKWCLDISLTHLKEMYQKLGIEFEHYHGESFYRDQLEGVEQMLKDSGVLEESKGALGVDCGAKLGFARVFTEDGRSLYITRDIATAIYREKTWKPKKILYVVAAQQSLHFQHLIKIFEKINHPVAGLIEHVAFGFVPGMSSRAGGAIALDEFLHEAYSRALEAYRDAVARRPEGSSEEDIAQKVSIGATYFYFLSHTNSKDFHFSWKEALNFQGETGPYLQYALARINSMEEKASAAGIEATRSKIDGSLLEQEEAFALAYLLSDFPQKIEEAASSNEPSVLAAYLIEVARAFSKAYNSLQVIVEDKDLASARLALFLGAKQVLKSGLPLIGIPLVERM